MGEEHMAHDIGALMARYALAPEAIEARSLAIAEAMLQDRFPDERERLVAARLLYAAADADLAGSLRFSAGAVDAGVAALRGGVTLVADVRMVVSGINTQRASVLGCPVRCAIDDPAVAERAKARGLPRAAEAMNALAGDLNGGIAVIGNAPTALLSLLDLADSGATRPALVIGMPVGFVAAAEAKEELASRDLPYLTLVGTRGGSPLAAAAVNALLLLAAREPLPDQRSCTAVLFVGHGSREKDAAEAMLAAVERVRRRGVYPIVEHAYLELAPPDLPEALHRCVEQGATRVMVVPYFLNQGVHIRRDIPAVLRREADNYPDLRISLAEPIGLHADLAGVMLAGALDAERLPDVRERDRELLNKDASAE